jgi:hypothetical protein
MNGKDTGKPVDDMRKTIKGSFDEVCSVAQKIKCMAQEIKDRLFGAEVSPDKSPGTAERLQPAGLAYIAAEGFSELRAIQGGAARVLDEILARL